MTDVTDHQVSDAPQATELVPGELLDGKYRVLKLLGIGGMGAVYAARRLALGDVVAIKCILQSQNTEPNRARFLREARAVARIRHPNVVQVFDFGEPPGRSPYMVMEYLEGPTLAQVLREEGRIGLERALWIFSGVCAAVEAGHRRGVIHRDLKPGNVMLARSDDGRETIKVLDFGLARLTTASQSLALTNPGSMLGTCSYMAPEQIEGGQSGPASDVFSLGVILYEMVTGSLPFRAPTQLATMLRIAEGKFDPPRQHLPDLPEAVDSALSAALSRLATDRPPSPEALAQRVGADFPQAPLSERSGRTPLPLRLDDDIDETSLGSGETTTDSRLDGDAADKTILGFPTVPQRSDASRGPELECFVGRVHELEMLRREYAEAIEGKGKVTVVTGDAGVGKTRVLEEFAKWAQRQGAVVLRGRFFSYEGDRPPPHETFLRMLAASNPSGPNRPPLAHENRSAGVDLDPGQDKWQAFSSIARGLAERAGSRPLVLALDDLQWATALDLEFLAYLPRAAGSAAVSIVGTARVHPGGGGASADLQRWLVGLGSQRGLTRVDVERFSPEDVRAWFDATFGAIRIRPRDIRRLHHATSGNPYYLAEVVRRLVSSSQIEREGSGWTCASLDDVELPETVQAVVQAKLEGLPERLRTVLETACVVGEEFRFETLQSAVAIAEEELEDLIDEAMRLHLLTEEGLSAGSDLRFHTPTLRQVLYAGMSARKRRRVHRAVVEALHRVYADDPERIAKVLCYHHHAVEDWEATLTWGLKGAIQALGRRDLDSADSALRRARKAAERLTRTSRNVSPREIAVLDRLTGALYNDVGRLEEAERLLLRAVGEAEAAGDDSLRLDGLLDLCECQLGRGEFESGITTAELAIEVASALRDVAREYAARIHLARCAAPIGKLDQAIAILTPVVEAIDPDLAALHAVALREMAWVHTKRGAWVDAEAVARQALEVARTAKDPLAEYQAVSALGLVYGEGGDMERSIPHLEEALGLARKLSLRRREAIELFNLGELYHLRGDRQLARVRTEEALAIFAEIQDRASEGDALVNLGRLLLVEGNRRAAIEALDKGRTLCAETGRSEYEALALLELGNARMQERTYDLAREHFERARSLFATMNSFHLWRAELGLARVALATGDRTTARGRARLAADLVSTHREELAKAMSTAQFDRAAEEVEAFIERIDE